jgi:hypothetical protein
LLSSFGDDFLRSRHDHSSDAKAVEKNHPSKPFYRLKMELLYVTGAVVDYYGAPGWAGFALRLHYWHNTASLEFNVQIATSPIRIVYVTDSWNS